VPLTDGLDFYRTLAAQAVSRLKPGGKIMLEFGDGQDGA
jgi:methylase of polypeptide subunit release factors